MAQQMEAVKPHTVNGKISGLVRRLDNLEGKRWSMSQPLKDVIAETKKALRAGDLTLASGLASVSNLISSTEGAKFYDSYDRQMRRQERDAQGVLNAINNELEKMTGKIPAGRWVDDEGRNGKRHREPPHSDNPVLRKVTEEFARTDKEQADQEAKYKAEQIAFWESQLKEVEGKTDEISRARRELAKAGLEHERGNISYEQFAKVREDPRNQESLAQYYEQERQAAKAKRRTEGVVARARGRETLKSDLDARFVNAFDRPYSGWKIDSDEFKGRLKEFKEQELVVGTKTNKNRQIGLLVNDQILQGKTISRTIAVRVNRKKLTDVEKRETEGFRSQALQLDGDIYDLEFVRKAVEVLGSPEPLLFQTLRTPDARAHDSRVLLVTDTKGNRLVIAPKILGSSGMASKERIEKLKSIPKLGEIGDIVKGFSPKIPVLPRGARIPKPKPYTERTLPTGYHTSMTWGSTPPPKEVAIPVKLPKTLGNRMFTDYTKAQAMKVVRQLRPYIGKKVYIFGGGGAGYELARLDAINAVSRRAYARQEPAPFEQRWKGVKVIEGYRFPKNAINIRMKGDKDDKLNRGTPTYSIPNEYSVVPILSGVGKTKDLNSRHSRFLKRELYGKDGNTPLKEPKLVRTKFEPSLGSWNIAIPNIYSRKSANSRKVKQTPRHHASRAEKGSRKVGPHGEIRENCIYCKREHSSDKHRFHGHGSYARTHEGGAKKEKML